MRHFWFLFYRLHSSSLRETKAGIEAETMGEWTRVVYWPASGLTLNCLFYKEQTNLPRIGTAYGGLDLYLSITNQDNAPQACQGVNLVEAILQLCFLPPRCAKQKTETPQHTVLLLSTGRETPLSQSRSVRSFL